MRLAAITGDAFVRAEDLEAWSSLRDEGRLRFRAAFQRHGPPWMTALLAGLQIRVWWLVQTRELSDLGPELLLRANPPLFEDGQVWRLLTAGFLHTSALHITSNLVFFLYTSWSLERVYRASGVLWIFLISILGGSLASSLGAPETSSLGSSGGVFGLVAGAVAFGLRHGELVPAQSRLFFGVALLPYLLLTLWSGLQAEGVDNYAHVGGAITGALAVLSLDPAGTERRQGWNRNVFLGSALACALLFLAIVTLGLRSGPLIPSPTRPGLRFDAPAGWVPRSTATGDAGFGRRDRPRALAVLEEEHERLPDTDSLAQAWVARVRQSFPEATFTELTDANLAGRPARTLTAQLPGSPPIVVDWTGATVGSRSLVAVWQREAQDLQRLEPLRQRLWEAIVWDPERDVPIAQAEVDRAPTPGHRAELATALVRAGRHQEGLELHRALVEERPEDLDRWRSLLTSYRLSPTGDEGSAGLHDELLTRAPGPASAALVVEDLIAREEVQGARHVAEAAWALWPGDRSIRRQRMRLQLSTALEASTGRPWWMVFDFAQGRAYLHPWLSDTPTQLRRADAQTLGEERDRAQQAAATQLPALAERDPRLAVWAACFLATGEVPDPEDRAEIAALLSDLASSVPDWLPVQGVERLRETDPASWPWSTPAPAVDPLPVQP